MSSLDDPSVEAQALAVRLFSASLGAAELMAVYLGVRLGLYQALTTLGAANAAQLADRSRIAPRYAREWLEQQAAAGIVKVQDASAAPDERVYTLPAGHAEALARADSPYWIAPLAVLPIGGMAGVLPLLLEAYRNGGGVPYEAYGADFRWGQAGLNRNIFLNLLPGWIRSALPDTHARLGRPGARAADIACGAGWSSIGLSLAYPRLAIDGFDLDVKSIAEARDNAAQASVAHRVRFAVQDGSDPALAGSYDLVCVFDALHDMPRPVELLKRCRELRASGGTVLLMEPKVGDTFAPPTRETERFLYAVSLLHCLPVGLSNPPSAGTGTVLRLGTLRGYAREAGFDEVEVLPVEHRFHRLYRLR